MEEHRQFEIGKAITQPFRMPGGRSLLIRIVLWGSALLLFAYFFFGRTILAGYIEMFQKIAELDATAEEDPAVVFEAMSSMTAVMGHAFLLSIIGWVIMACMESTMHKNMFHKTEHAIFPFRFGAAELRVMLAQIIVYAICMGAYIACYIGLIIVILIAAVLAETAGVLGAILATILGLGSILVMIGALVFILARFSPAAALSVKDNDVRTVEGWRITKERYWPIIWSYVIVGLVGYFVISIFVVIGVIVTFSAGDLFSLFGQLEGNDDPSAIWSSISAAFNQPKVIIPLTIIIALTTFITMVWYLCYWGIANYVAQLYGDETLSEYRAQKTGMTP